ncbi:MULTISPECIES: FMN-binding protein [unclassified Streptomyces]|uniref:FMN-binding protein n=1 Tax=unclassified Streptomyces TaxID=2593676 RepID=UPI002258DFC6|nr:MULTISPECIES: FMN-binding protein [unclassified Streptomyces]MCX4401956.1 FMN-binding protein [Streptomyces sp. NBC_01764]MCX5183385.1 FMN-binding protein [Streptomyces sp. NBC_00268]
MHALKKHRPLRRVMLAAATTVTGFVLLLSLKPHTPPTVAQASSSAGQSPSRSQASPAPSGTPSPGSTKSTGTKTVTGDTVQTRWGPVQVRITLKNGKITDVTAVSYPSDNPRDQEINSYALPQLRREALAAQSASIDSVSGASYTSDGYKQSLQSALDSAGL